MRYSAGFGCLLVIKIGIRFHVFGLSYVFSFTASWKTMEGRFENKKVNPDLKNSKILSKIGLLVYLLQFLGMPLIFG